MMATPFAAAPSASLVVRREKRRRRKAVGQRCVPLLLLLPPSYLPERRTDAFCLVDRSATGRPPRHGFVFGDQKGKDDHAEPPEAAVVSPARKASAPSSQTDTTFVFRVRKDDDDDELGKQRALDAATASAALRAKQEKAARAEYRRLRRQKKREDVAREALNEEEMKHKKLSADQVALYRLVQRQAKRELRKVRKEFEASSARRDIAQLSETSAQAMKQELIAFMTAHPPGNVTERQWLEIKTAIEAERTAAPSASPGTGADAGDVASSGSAAAQAAEDASSQGPPETLPCELKVAQEVEALQRSALQQLGSSTRQLTLLDASMLTVDRLVVEAEMKKAQLFGAFHDSAFKGYANLAHPKENLRALLKLRTSGVP
ncbi:hypothetical protein BBJ28_00022068 [Nothophytophthora sp. Chile5]|nr:hypothetical protein BBJ28_00022068 [Nothophytophthora sp. Chile5]